MAQTFDEFISKRLGYGVDVDNYPKDNPYQCMDLMHIYCVEVLGISDLSVLRSPSAKDVFLNFPNVTGNALFEKIDNTPDNVPQKGDIIFWGTEVGPAGHVAIFIDGDVHQFKSFDQNWPVGSLCSAVTHTYKGVLGWLRFKGTPEVKTTQQFQQELLSQQDATSQCQTQLKTALDQVIQLQSQIDSYNSQVSGYKMQLNDLQTKYDSECRKNQDLNEANKKISGENQDNAEKAYDSERLAKDRANYLHMIADSLQIQYDPTDDKKLVDEVLHSVATMQKQQQENPEITQLQAIVKQFISMGINNYLTAKGLETIDFTKTDPQLIEKISLYMSDLTNELLSMNAGITPITTTVSESVKAPKKGFFSSVLQSLLQLVLVQE